MKDNRYYISFSQNSSFSPERYRSDEFIRVRRYQSGTFQFLHRLGSVCGFALMLVSAAFVARSRLRSCCCFSRRGGGRKRTIRQVRERAAFRLTRDATFKAPPGNPTHLQPSLEAGALTHFPSVHEQRSARSEVCDIVKFVSPAVQGAQEQISQPNYIHHLSLCSSFCGFCSCSCLPFRLKLPAAFTQPGASTLSDFCRKFRSIHDVNSSLN